MASNQKNEKIYVVGHKNPDTDSICSAIAYANYLNKRGKTAVAARAGEVNPETKYVLDYFKTDIPELLSSAADKKLILVDHNEKTQSPDNIEKAEILEVIDHHKILFELAEPIFFSSEPVGSTATLIAKKYLAEKIKITKNIAGILLSAILSDTVIFRSPTTTKEDINIAKKLSKISGIKNLEKFGIGIKEKKATLKGLGAESIIYSDFKILEAKGKKFGVGQIEVCDLKEAEKRKVELIEKLKNIAREEGYNLIILMVTDIIKKNSKLLFSGEKEYLEKAFNKKTGDDSLYLEGVMSRKKEILPPLMKIL